MSTYVNIKCVLTDSCNYNNNNERIDYIPYKLKEWVDIDKLDLKLLSLNPRSINLMYNYKDKFYDMPGVWNGLCNNPNGTRILLDNIDKINWESLSSNPTALSIALFGDR